MIAPNCFATVFGPMIEFLEGVRPIVSGLAGAAVVGLMCCMAKADAPIEGTRKVLRFGTGFRILSVILIPLTVLVAYAAVHSREDQIFLAIGVASAFIAGGVFLVYQAYFVKFSYDRHNVYYETPFTGELSAPWTNLSDVGHSTLIGADYIVVEGIGRIWCSNMLDGYDELGAFLEHLVGELDDERDSGA